MTTLPTSSMTESFDSPLAASGARRASGAAHAAPPNPEVVAVAKRRRFSGADKQRILQAADRCTDAGEIGALMRREGLYASLLYRWRRQRREIEREALAPKRRGPKPDVELAEQRQVEQLTRENTRLEGELKRAHTIIDVQKKLCTLLGLPTAPENSEDI
jgi:transposase